MSLSLNTLSSQLQQYVVAASTEAQAITNFAQAYSAYAAAASANGVPISKPAISIAQAAMAQAMPGLNTPGGAAVALQKGCAAFWANLAIQPSVTFAAATLLTPPLFATTVALLQAAFATNAANKIITNSQALSNIAGVLHAQTLLGGSATFPGPLVAPIL